VIRFLSALVAVVASLCSGAQAQILGNSGSVLNEAFGARHLLVVCGSSEAALGEGILDEQFREADWPGYAGRGISLIGLSAGIELVFDTASVAAGEVKLHIWHDGDAKLEQAAGCDGAVRSVMLIATDGKVHGRWESVVSNETLFPLVDAVRSPRGRTNPRTE
jgi:hypothetical protein